jgi:hypothetical protein
MIGEGEAGWEVEMAKFWELIWSWLRSFFAPQPLAGLKVGFLSTVKRNDARDFLTAFERGLGSNVDAEKYADGKYGHGSRRLVDLALELMNGRDKVDVIAATGGRTALQAVVDAANQMGSAVKIPIVFLGDLEIAHSNISGGLVLEMPSYNGDRVTELRKPPYNATKVGLLVNLNAAGGPDEARNWNTSWGPVQAVGGAEDNDNINFQQAISLLVAAGANGIVVAGDSFFTSKAASLVALVNNADIPVCYPFQSYKDAGPGAKRGKSMRYGVNLNTQYATLGGKVKAVIDALRANPGTIPSVGIDPIPSTIEHWR